MRERENENDDDGSVSWLLRVFVSSRFTFLSSNSLWNSQEMLLVFSASFNILRNPPDWKIFLSRGSMPGLPVWSTSVLVNEPLNKSWKPLLSAFASFLSYRKRFLWIQLMIRLSAAFVFFVSFFLFLISEVINMTSVPSSDYPLSSICFNKNNKNFAFYCSY